MPHLTRANLFSSFTLHLIAMATMLADHVGVALFPQWMGLRLIGRLAFPLFAFLAAEGAKHTRNMGRYLARLFLAAVLSEIPFDLVATGKLWDFSYQNVLWTLLIAQLAIALLSSPRWPVSTLAASLTGKLAVLAGSLLLASLFSTDYGGAGVSTVFLFYYIPADRGKGKAWQLMGMVLLHGILLYSPNIYLSAGPFSIPFSIQIAALLALPVIWLYQGKQGPHGRGVRLLFYSFYPLHLMALALVRWRME